MLQPTKPCGWGKPNDFWRLWVPLSLFMALRSSWKGKVPLGPSASLDGWVWRRQPVGLPRTSIPPASSPYFPGSAGEACGGWPCGFVVSMLGLVQSCSSAPVRIREVSGHDWNFIPFPPCPNPQNLNRTQCVLLQTWLSQWQLNERDLSSLSYFSPSIPLPLTPPKWVSSLQ